MTYDLTKYSRSSGCGCKIAPAVLDEILKTAFSRPADKLIVGNSTKDDAAVYDTGNGIGLVSTADFFTPVVEDAVDFGRIASANAISDVYAMGGRPILAIAILGWPIDKLPPELAREVLKGARQLCAEATIPLAGGHSIDSPEPFFGLAVNGLVGIKNIKRNSTAQEGDLIYLTKKLGTGILSTATKRGLINEGDKKQFIETMSKLNSIGMLLGDLPEVTAMTDVTGFGLLGHLAEMAEGSELSAELDYNKIPLLDGLQQYTSVMCVPDNTFKNWNAVEPKTEGITAESLLTLCDPQTNGGLLFTIRPDAVKKAQSLLRENGLEKFSEPIGRMVKKVNKILMIQ